MPISTSKGLLSGFNPVTELDVKAHCKEVLGEQSLNPTLAPLPRALQGFLWPQPSHLP